MNFAIVKRIKSDTHFRIKLLLCLSLSFNLAYSVFLFAVSQLQDEKWFFVMSIYYALLSIARGVLFMQIKPEKKLRSKLKTMRVCGCFLLLINLAVSTLIFLLVFRNYSVKHHEITVITLATYTFSTLTLAIIGSVKYVKRKETVYSCVKFISLISASVSILTLANTMLATFGENTEKLRSIILPLLSIAVSVFIVATSVFMIRQANSKLKDIRNEKE